MFPNGVISNYGYDAQGRLNTLTHTLGANPNFTDFGYTYNPVGNIHSIIDNLNAAQTRTSTYDALQRLKTGGTTTTLETYDYDLTGNRTTSFLSATHTHDDANRLLLNDDDFTYTLMMPMGISKRRRVKRFRPTSPRILGMPKIN